MKQLFRTCNYIRSWGYRFANDYMYKDTGLLYVYTLQMLLQTGEKMR